nr:core protein C [Hepacivirus P]
MMPKMSSKQQKPKMRGRVVGGVYVVNAKKSTEAGSRRPRRRRRDQGGWRKTPLGQGDVYVQRLVQTIAPTHAYGPNDPRRRSRFLGHIVDGSLGWAADLLHQVPLVGPLLGHPARLICRVIRAGEDSVNSLTGIAGVHLFILCLILSLSPGLA